MSIIQDIRDKYAKVSVVAIALALIGFILTDYFSGKNRAGGIGRANSVGSINGRSVSAEEFAKEVDQTEAEMKQQGYPDMMAKQQAVEQAWQQQVNQLLLKDEMDKLGIRIGKKERGDILFGPNAPEDIRKAGIDENTGQYDAVRAKQQIDQMMKSPQVTKEQKEQFNQYIQRLEDQRRAEKYFTLFTNSNNFPRWLVEKQTADNSLLGKISIVKTFYTDSSFVDSTIKISDKEIADYISKHKDNFKQEESRSINYVAFSAAPTSADSLVIKNQLLSLKPEFDTITQDVSTFLARNGSAPTSEIFTTDSLMPESGRDSIIKLAKNQVVGPFLDNGVYILAKKLDTKILPDSVKCRHILLGTQDRQGKKLMEDSVAEKLARTIERAIKGGVSFDTLETKYTTDQAAHKDKGVMTFASSTIQGDGFAKEFGQFILFDGKPGDKKVVKTQFGWHYIEILSFIKPQPQYKIAYLTQEVVASQQTDGDALQAATNFAGDSKDLNSFVAAFEKTLKPKGLNMGTATNIRRMDGQVRGVGLSRSLVRNIYNAKKGEVLKPERVGNEYIVSIITDVLEEGTQSVARARFSVEPLLRNQKKAAMLKQKIGNITSLEAASAALNKPIEVVDSLRMESGSPKSNFGNEPKVNGATFNPANKGKVVPEMIEGLNGVYVVRVDEVTATSSMTGSVDEQRKNLYQQSKQSGYNPIEAIKNASTIKDKRADRY